MSSMQAIHELMAQAGPILDLLQVTEYADDRAWTLVFAEDSRVDVEYDETGDRLVLTSEIGTIPQGAREKAYEALLHYNYIWPVHGGVRSAVEPATGGVVLMIDLAAGDLEISRLASVLQNFRTVADGWRGVLAGIPAGGTGKVEVGMPSGGMIRV